MKKSPDEARKNPPPSKDPSRPESLTDLNLDENVVDKILNELDTAPVVSPRHMTLVLRDIAYALDELKTLINNLMTDKPLIARLTSRMDASVGNYQLLLLHQNDVVKRLNKIEEQIIKQKWAFETLRDITEQLSVLEEFFLKEPLPALDKLKVSQLKVSRLRSSNPKVPKRQRAMGIIRTNSGENNDTSSSGEEEPTG
jgi:predicted component of type VI protein secretion system